MHVQLLRSTIPPILGSRATRHNVAQTTAIRSEDRWKGVCCQRLGLGNNNNVKINSYNIYTQRSRSTTDSQVISRTLGTERTVVPQYLEPHGILVYLPYYESLDWEVNGGGLEQEDVAEEPVEQQRHKLYLRSGCCSCTGNQWHAWIPGERRRWHDVISCAWKYSIYK